MDDKFQDFLGLRLELVGLYFGLSFGLGLISGLSFGLDFGLSFDFSFRLRLSLGFRGAIVKSGV